MDFLFYSLGSADNVLPMVHLALALDADGNKVGFIGSENFYTHMKHSNIEYHSVRSSQDFNRTYGTSLPWADAGARNHFLDYHLPAIKPSFEFVANIVERGLRPTVLFQDVLSGASMAAVNFDLPFVRLALSPSEIFSTKSPPYPLRLKVKEELWEAKLPLIREQALQSSFKHVLQPYINPVREELGLEPWAANDLLGFEKKDQKWLALFPEWFKERPTDWPDQLLCSGFIMNSTGQVEEDQLLSRFIDANGSPLVFIIDPGIMVPPALTRKAARVCAKINRPGVFISETLDEGIQEARGQQLLTLKTAPLEKLLNKARIVIHQGGSETSAQALDAGCPQLVSPVVTPQQPDNAWCTFSLGVGNAIDFISASVDEIVDAIQEITQSHDTLSQCKNIANRASDGTESAVRFLASMRT